MKDEVISFNALGMADIKQVGGKNASLGEMISELSDLGVKVPGGFATTSESFEAFLAQNDTNEQIYQKLDNLDCDDVNELAKVGAEIRALILDLPLMPKMVESIKKAYAALGDNCSVAVRSSATAEDLPDASFAGQQETFLNVVGVDNVLIKIKEVYASLFNDRAISYRVHKGFTHRDVHISVGIQQMVRSDKASSGVMFSIDTESGFSDVVFITSSYGLGEMVVQGAVNPDEFYVHKPTLNGKRPAIVKRALGSKETMMIFNDDVNSDETVSIIPVEKEAQSVFSLTDNDIETLAKYALVIENHYKRPMDIEWGKDGISGELFILQARPETVNSQNQQQIIERYQIDTTHPVIVEGRSIGQKIGQGQARVISDLSEMDKVNPGDVLVTDMTDPDWEPIMKRASAIVTNRGGRTCHAAIIARELGIPAIVGTGNGTKKIKDKKAITVNCASGDTGFVYEGIVPFEKQSIDIGNMPELPVKIMLNVGNPDRAFAFTNVPNSGVGLARLEFLISNTIGIHPKALLDFDLLEDKTLKSLIAEKTKAYASPTEFYIERLKEGMATIAASFYPQKVIVRLSDFKSNEYANLLGGQYYEPDEENPMLGFRGASRYSAPSFADCFSLECEAVKRVRNEMGLTNIEVMIPFVRTVNEAKNVIQTLEANGLKRGENGLRVIMMCELPSNAILADEFLKHFDGFSIGSNDLTQLTLGLDRDSGLVANQFDERDEAVKRLLSLAIDACKKAGKYIGICGQGPSDHADLALWLMEKGIDSMSLNPDSVLETSLFMAKHSKKQTETA